jgi:bifunctional DNA-binding transcriptional regulator/antitoxin component of YhaV-PrlF toxin-antitoxin module
MVRTCVENGKTVVPEEVRIVLYVKKKEYLRNGL